MEVTYAICDSVEEILNVEISNIIIMNGKTFRFTLR